MPLLFSYGTLQRPEIQLATFGRLLSGHEDEVFGFEPAPVPILDPEVVASTGQTHYVNATRTADPNARVTGRAFEVTEAELLQADKYEKPAGYSRILIGLGSGKQAWMYVEAAQR